MPHGSARNSADRLCSRALLTTGVTDVIRIHRHLKHELGFAEVGFAPVTTSPDRLHAIDEKGMDGVLDQFKIPAEEYLEFALRGELRQGVNKSYLCGAALGLLGLGPSGDIAPCHRFVESAFWSSSRRERGWHKACCCEPQFS